MEYPHLCFCLKFFFFLTARQLRGHIFSCSPGPPLNNLIHHTSLLELTKKNATKLMATAASVSNYIQSKREQCVVITSIALTICSTSFISFMCSCQYILALGYICFLVFYGPLFCIVIFFGYFQITHLYYTKFLAKKIQTKSKQQFHEK